MAGGVIGARRLVVRGRVQGVFFRDEMKKHADAEQLAGWVRNRDDGALEAWLEGETDGIDTVVRWARRGPRDAGVDDVAVERVEPQGHTRFDVR